MKQRDGNGPYTKDLKNCFTVLLEQYKGQLQTAKMSAEQCGDGSWQDINNDDQNRSNWNQAQHLIYLRFMAVAWSDPTDPPFHKRNLTEELRRGIEFWLKGKFFCDIVL